jgi:hypothetical protein
MRLLLQLITAKLVKRPIAHSHGRSVAYLRFDRFEVWGRFYELAINMIPRFAQVHLVTIYLINKMSTGEQPKSSLCAMVNFLLRASREQTSNY